ncbi:hypothetical protein [Streptomyces mirabilis]|nr:hypothetical protein [Streptomyces mirabilis]MCX4419478.1 hypothetical protein [Streptomyces mirabilis]
MAGGERGGGQTGLSGADDDEVGVFHEIVTFKYIVVSGSDEMLSGKP